MSIAGSIHNVTSLTDSDSEDAIIQFPESPPSGQSQWRAPSLPVHSRPPSPFTPALSQSPATDAKPPGLVGLSDPVLSDLRRKKLDIVNRLHNLGVQRDIDLPSLIVIGSQSAGKSSLIESISGITLPRAGGTCTRCPTECRLVRTSGSEPWQCTVSLRFLTDYESNRPLGKVENIEFGPVITNPNEVEERLRRAQLAILNPSADPQVFLNRNYRQLRPNSLNFSSNTICLEIKSPDLTDLSFCDLPGLIASVADGGRDEDVEEVYELVSTYIQKPSCIILLAVSCEVDFETQGAYRLAKKYDPEGVRTIGVLTKPDRIPEGEHARWLKLIRNESSPLQNGWFCVKQLSSAELEKHYSFEDARRLCDNFFKQEPWNIPDQECQKRLGTKAVTAKLNEFLLSVISKRIPEIMQEVQMKILMTKEDMEALPAPPSSDPVLALIHGVNEFCDAVYYHSEGVYLKDGDNTNKLSENQFEAIRMQQKRFKAVIHSTAPRFRPYVHDPPLHHEIFDHRVDLVEEFGGRFEEEPTPPGSPVEKIQVPNEILYLDDTQVSNPIYLDDISNTIAGAITRELPGFYPFQVVQKLITVYTEKWKQPAFDLVNKTFQIVVEHQARLVQKHFGQHTAGGLPNTVRNLVYGYMQNRKESAGKLLEWMLKLESSAFTLDDSMFLKYKQECLEKYKQERSEKYQNGQYGFRNRPMDEGASELTVMATVEAYFQVAHRRFVDNIPLTIDHELVRVDKRSLQEVLYKGLKLTGPDANTICARFMAEPTHISDFREELGSRLKRLTAAQGELMDV